MNIKTDFDFGNKTTGSIEVNSEDCTVDVTLKGEHSGCTVTLSATEADAVSDILTDAATLLKAEAS